MADTWNSIYQFESADTLSTRIRRLERGRQTLRRGTIIPGSGNYSAMPADILTGNSIDLASPTVTPQGSVPPLGVKGNFGFSATTTTITIYWDGTNNSALLSLMRANGSVVQIVGGSLTVSGLSSATSYGFLPYWSPFNNCGIGWLVGDAGSPLFAFTAAARTTAAAFQQLLQGREQLTQGFVTYSTTSGGTSTGSGGGGGQPGHCVMLGTDIEPLGDNQYSTKHYPETEWLRIACERYPRTLPCTFDHPLISPDKGKQSACKFKDGDWIVTDDGEHKIASVEKFVRVCTKVEVHMNNGHLFFANGYLSHNAKYSFL